MTTALLSIHLMRLVTSRRPDLRPAERADLVTRIIRLGADHAGLDGDGVARLSPDAQALIGSPPHMDPPAPPAPPDTADLQRQLADEDDPIRRAQIRARIGRANGITSTKENP